MSESLGRPEFVWVAPFRQAAGKYFYTWFLFFSNWRSVKNKMTWILPSWKSLRKQGWSWGPVWLISGSFIHDMILPPFQCILPILKVPDDFLHSAAWLYLSFSYFSVWYEAGKIAHWYHLSHCFWCREAQSSSKIALLYTWCGQIKEFLKLLMLTLFLLLLCLYYCIVSPRELCVLKWVELLKWSGEVNLELACPFPIKQRPKSIWWRWEIKEEVEDGFVCVPSARAAEEESSHSGHPALIISSGLLGACQHQVVHCEILLGNCDF